MSEDRRIARVTANTLHREVQGEAILLHLDSGEYFGLDSVATRVWQLIIEKGDLGDVKTTLLEEFDVDESVLSHDFDQMIADLVAKRLIEIDEAPSVSGSR